MVTTTTSKVVYGDDDETSMNNYHMNRKQELREFKMLQKQEQKQFQDLTFKAHLLAEAQVKGAIPIKYLLCIMVRYTTKLLFNFSGKEIRARKA